MVAEGKYWRCPNVYDCEPQVIGRTLALTRRGAFEIDGLGEKMALQLHAAGHLRSPSVRTFGLGPAVFRNWDRGDDAAWSWGVEGYIGVIVGILRVGGGYRHLPEDSGGDTFFLNLGVSDFNALTRLVLLL